ncbi:hypothetical protein CQW23_25015 [Capsicum baccatum]|uniref:Disease resistance protein At4g27190-like leucine-rich repeats domain-containing protein n=1 Tax=Capsicum baccatum TaxID=33114 RepID=A0A2G2VWF7_CAPBA|nr:hypothetical protein CQW23_25015 [Capsicum baccatum]
MKLIPCQCLQVSCPNLEVLSIWESNSITALCSHQLPTAYFSKLKKLNVWNCGKLRHLMSPSVARGLLNLHELWIRSCQSMEEVIIEEEQHGDEIMCNEPLFPQLEKLNLQNLPKLGHFVLTTHALEFSSLKDVMIDICPEMKTFVQQGTASTPSLEIVNDDDELKVVDLNKAMFNSKVSCPNLQVLELYGDKSISTLCSHQLPMGYFSKLEKLEVENCGKLRNLISPLVASGLLNLRTLRIKECQSMEEVITEEEQQGEEIMTNKPSLFPMLEELILHKLPKLGHFFQTKRALEFPFLIRVMILECHEMKTFVQKGSVSTPVLEIVNDDLNKWVQQSFNSKEQESNQGGYQSEASDHDESDAINDDESEAIESLKDNYSVATDKHPDATDNTSGAIDKSSDATDKQSNATDKTSDATDYSSDAPDD